MLVFSSQLVGCIFFLSSAGKADGTEEDESLEEDDFEDTDELLDEEDDVEMPPKKTAAAAKKAPDTDADTKLSAGVKAMSISKAPKYQPYSMSFSFPFMIKEFIHDNRKSCTVDILVPTVAEDRVRPVVSTDLEYLLVSIVVPEFFPEYQRIEASNFGDDTFHGNTSVATAHHKVIVQSIRTAFNGQPEVIGEPMKIKLPFKVEESIAHWELQLFNGDAEVSAAAGDQQYFSMLKVDLISIERVFRRVTGGMRVVGSPNAADHRAAAAAAGGGP